MTAAVPPHLASALGARYELERELGAGGMARVYVARDRKHGRRVAVKVLRPELASTLGAERFLREVAIVAALQHPHVLTLIDSGEATTAEGGGLLYYVMPYVDGESLRARLDREGALPLDEALQLLREVADALAYAHRRGIVHRDVKPDNVLLAEGHALVVDFGIAKALAAASGEGGGEGRGAPTLTLAGTSLGTPAYMAPEQAAGDPEVDHRADVYAAGVLGYEMLAGRPPFVGPPQAVLAAHVTAAPPPLETLRPDVPAPLAGVVARCLAKAPADRFPTAEALLDALRALEAPAPVALERERRGRRRAWLAAGAVSVAALAAVAGLVVRDRRERRVREILIPAAQQVADDWTTDSAFVLTARAAAVLPDDPAVRALWPRVARWQSFRSEPAGARVLRAAFGDTTRWTLLGTTPLDSVRVPLALSRFRLVRDGHRTAELLAGGAVDGEHVVTGATLPAVVPLLPAADPDSDMVLVRAPALEGAADPLQPLGTYRVDRHEVSNARYRAFVDAGGYTRRELWPDPILDDEGRPMRWEAAMARFVDRTGRPGPATWEAGAPPPGTDAHPVSGVSWYEAAAYARFAGKALPTVHHWLVAAGLPAAAWVVPGSVFQAPAPAPVGPPRGLSPWGAADMAGNVREWCANDDGSGRRYILGGGWADFAYAFTDRTAQRPLDRSPINGIRLVRYGGPPTPAQAAPVPRATRDLARERPASDAEYAAFRRLYDYDPQPVDARVLARDTTPADWVVERVALAAAYGAPGAPETLQALVFLPRRHPPPYRAVVLFPGSDAQFQRSGGESYGEHLGWLLRAGRALVLPIYKGTYERHDGLADQRSAATVAYRDLVLMWAKDLRRTIDYLGTRPDVDTTSLGYLGVSLGARMGGVMLAVEPRLRAGVLIAGGFSSRPMLPEVDPLHHLPRVRVPVLMLNGRYDDVFPLESAQRPFFAALGTAPAHKRLVLNDEGHYMPRTQAIVETLAWFDRYLGPPRR